MTCWADMADRQRQADEADAAEYSEELERRTLALMELNQPCDPLLLSNKVKAILEIGDNCPNAISEFWYDRAEARAAADMKTTNDY